MPAGRCKTLHCSTGKQAYAGRQMPSFARLGEQGRPPLRGLWRLLVQERGDGCADFSGLTLDCGVAAIVF
jgi:hypothetical protein